MPISVKVYGRLADCLHESGKSFEEGLGVPRVPVRRIGVPEQHYHLVVVVGQPPYYGFDSP